MIVAGTAANVVVQIARVDIDVSSAGTLRSTQGHAENGAEVRSFAARPHF